MTMNEPSSSSRALKTRKRGDRSLNVTVIRSFGPDDHLLCFAERYPPRRLTPWKSGSSSRGQHRSELRFDDDEVAPINPTVCVDVFAEVGAVGGLSAVEFG